MLKVMLVDDEPFVIQGLKRLIDWEKYGSEVSCTAENGKEALELLSQNQVDLIIADISMPEMTGLELLKRIREQHLSDAFFVILSGYSDFSYAQEAIRNNCNDYILKPVETDKLIEIIEKAKSASHSRMEQAKILSLQKQAYDERNMLALISGKYDDENVAYIKENLHLSDPMQYVSIQLNETRRLDDGSDEERRAAQKKIYRACREYLNEEKEHVIFDVTPDSDIYDVGIIYCPYMANKTDLDEEHYLESLLAYVRAEIGLPVTMLVGKQIRDITQIARSYSSVCMLRFVLGFREKKDIYYYEMEMQVHDKRVVILKDEIDLLIRAVEQNHTDAIKGAVREFYQKLHGLGANATTMNLNINYFLFHLIHVATEQNSEVDQEEILNRISEGTFSEGIARGSMTHLKNFALEYAEYLSQLRKHVSRGVIGEIERDVRKNYATNLTLKSLSRKYYVNSAYLGQLFRKNFGQSFKDYLNSYRIEQACQLLIRTDDKIYEIAVAVGYHDLDYFVNRFIAIKSCTPAKYRKNYR